jgi:hypothetical protein
MFTRSLEGLDLCLAHSSGAVGGSVTATQSSMTQHLARRTT